MWSQRGQGQYDDESDLFCVVFPPAVQARLFEFYNASDGDRAWDQTGVRRALVIATWKLFHPGSYYLWVNEKLLANPQKYKKWDNTKYRAKKDTLGSVPLHFNVFRKRVISLIVCDWSHFDAFFAVNVGAALTKEDTGEVDDPPTTSFILDTDSMYTGNKSFHGFVYFILEMARLLEVWVGNYICLRVGDPLPTPDFDAIIREARATVHKRTALICKVPIFLPPNRTRQSDDFNCGVFAGLNVYSVYQAERQHWFRLDQHHSSPQNWYDNIIRPFWNLPTIITKKNAVSTKAMLKARLVSF
jgi:hypothetical protein